MEETKLKEKEKLNSSDEELNEEDFFKIDVSFEDEEEKEKKVENLSLDWETLVENPHAVSPKIFEQMAFVAASEGDVSFLQSLADFDKQVDRKMHHIYEMLPRLDAEEQKKYREWRIRKAQATMVGCYLMEMIDLAEIHRLIIEEEMPKLKKELLMTWEDSTGKKDISFTDGQRVERTKAKITAEREAFEKMVDEEIECLVWPELKNQDEFHRAKNFLMQEYKLLQAELEAIKSKKNKCAWPLEDHKEKFKAARQTWAEAYLQKKIKHWVKVVIYVNEKTRELSAEEKQQLARQDALLGKILHASVPLSITDASGDTLLHTAIRHCQQPEIFKFLLKRGAKLETTNAAGISALKLIVQYGNLVALDMAVSRGVSVEAVMDEKDKRGNTLLHHAVQDPQYYHLARHLLQRGANLLAPNREGKTPWDLFAASGYKTSSQGQKFAEVLSSVLETHAKERGYEIAAALTEKKLKVNGSISSSASGFFVQHEDRQADCCRRLFKQAEALLRQNKPDEAIAPLTLLVNLDPQNPHPLLVRAKAFAQKGYREKAVNDLEKALALEEKSLRASSVIRVEIYLELGISHDKMGDKNQALHFYSKLLEIDAQNYLGLSRRANIYWQTGKLDEGDKDFVEALKINPGDALLYLNRGENRFLLRGGYPEALEDFEQALQLKPQWEPAERLRSMTLSKMAKQDQEETQKSYGKKG